MHKNANINELFLKAKTVLKCRESFLHESLHIQFSGDAVRTKANQNKTENNNKPNQTKPRQDKTKQNKNSTLQLQKVSLSLFLTANILVYPLFMILNLPTNSLF